MELFVWGIIFFCIVLLVVLLAVNRDEYIGRMGVWLGLTIDLTIFLSLWIGFIVIVKIIEAANVYM